MDLISELPESIIHIIMSLLPSCDVAKTGVLSKRWNQIWESYPFWDFNQTYFDPNERFINFVKRKLQKFRRMEVCLPKLKLFVNHVSPEILGLVDELITIAADKNVEEMDLFIQYNAEFPYTLPQKVLAVKTLNVLKLCGCRINPSRLGGLLSAKERSMVYPLRKLLLGGIQIDDELIQGLFNLFPLIEELSVRHCWGFRTLSISKLVKLKKLDVVFHQALPKKVEIDAHMQSLRTLYLECVILDEKMVESISERCPFMEQVVLTNCRGLRHFNISGLVNLKRLGLVLDSEGMESIDLQIPGLEGFDLDCSRLACSPLINIDAVTCKRLKFLELTHVAIHDNTLHELISKFSLLEVLSLSYCNLLKKVEISSNELKSLTLNRCMNLENAKIDTPQLSSLHYIGETIPYFLLVNAQCKWEVTIDLSGRDHLDNGFFLQLKNFMRKSTQMKALKLLFISAKSMTAGFDIQQLGDPILAPENRLELLQLNIFKPSCDYAALLDGLLWGCCPKKICLELHCKYAMDCIMIVSEKLKERDNCSSPASIDSFWRQCTRGDAKMAITVRINKQKRLLHWSKSAEYNSMNLNILLDDFSIMEADQVQVTLDLCWV